MPLRRLVIAVALIALAHGLLWSVLIPPFQSPDETEHFAYAQYLAETGRLPPKVGNSSTRPSSSVRSTRSARSGSPATRRPSRR